MGRAGSARINSSIDGDLSLYYMRTRYYNPMTGRFLTRDSDAGRTLDPTTLHYLYASSHSVDKLDPTGRAFKDYTVTVERNPVFIASVVGANVLCVAYNYAAPPGGRAQGIFAITVWCDSAWTLSFYGYDGLGSVRLLTDALGTVTDTYDYDVLGQRD